MYYFSLCVLDPLNIFFPHHTCSHRPWRELLRQRPCAVGLPTRWPRPWLLRALPEVWAPSHLASSVMLTPCSCTGAHVLVSAGANTAPSSALSPSPTKYPTALGVLETGHKLRAMDRGHSSSHSLLPSGCLHPSPPSTRLHSSHVLQT